MHSAGPQAWGGSHRRASKNFDRNAQKMLYTNLYNNPSYSRILIGSCLRSIKGQTHDWRHHYRVFAYAVLKWRKLSRIRIIFYVTGEKGAPGWLGGSSDTFTRVFAWIGFSKFTKVSEIACTSLSHNRTTLKVNNLFKKQTSCSVMNSSDTWFLRTRVAKTYSFFLGSRRSALFLAKSIIQISFNGQINNGSCHWTQRCRCQKSPGQIYSAGTLR